MNEIRLPYDYIPSPTVGNPIASGYIYIGTAGTDPTVVLNQISVSARQEDGTEVAISQPIRTNAGGNPVLGGSPVTLLISEVVFSITVQNSSGAQVYTQSNAKSIPVSGAVQDVYENVAALVASSPPAGLLSTTKGYTVAGDGGGGDYLCKTAAQATADGDTIDEIGAGFTAANGNVWVLQIEEDIRLAQFGVKGGLSAGQSTAIQAGYDYANALKTVVSPTSGQTAAASQPWVIWPKGKVLLDAQIDMAYYDRTKGQGTIVSPHGTFAGTYAMSGNFGGWEWEMSGMRFDGFTNDIFLDNNNTDQGVVNFYDVKHYGSTKAVHIDCQSSVVTFDSCKYDKCVTSHYIEACDKVEIKNSWIKQADITTNGGATITNYGRLTMTNNIMVPIAATGTETAWINNYDTVRLMFNRFGGESGAKTVVNNHAEGESVAPVTPNGVIAYGNQMYSVDGVGVARVSVRLYAVPNLLILKDNYGMVDQVLMGWASSVTPATLIAAVGRDRVKITADNFSGQTAYQGIYEPANYILPEFYGPAYRDVKILEVVDSTTNVSESISGWTITNNDYTALNANAFLPAAVEGLEFTLFRNNTSRLLRGYPEAGETIGTGGAGKYIQIDTDKVSLTLKCFVAGHWDIVNQSGAAWGAGYSYQP